MKAKFWLFLLFSFVLFKSKGQTPASFPKDSAQWINHHYGYPGFDDLDPSDYFDTLYCLTMKGDTMIGSNNYKKLRQFKKASYLGTPTLTPEIAIGALRYDSILNEVYYYSYSTGLEKTAYKFDLMVGDNFVTKYTPQTFDSLIVRTVDSTINFTTYVGVTFTRNVRYLIHENCGWPGLGVPALVNNIGGGFGFLQKLCSPEFHVYELQCFSDLGLGDAASFPSYSTLAGIHTLSNDDDFTVYPSPATTSVTVSFKGASGGKGNQIRTYDIVGQELYLNQTGNISNIDIRSYKPGIYFVELNTGNRIFVKKIVKH